MELPVLPESAIFSPLPTTSPTDTSSCELCPVSYTHLDVYKRQLLVTASAITEDFYHNKIRKNASEKELMWVSRGCVMAVSYTHLDVYKRQALLRRACEWSSAWRRAARNPVRVRG